MERTGLGARGAVFGKGDVWICHTELKAWGCWMGVDSEVRADSGPGLEKTGVPGLPACPKLLPR